MCYISSAGIWNISRNFLTRALLCLTDRPRSDSPTPFTDDDLEIREMGKGDFADDEKTLRGTTTRHKGPLLPTTRPGAGSTRRNSTGPRSRLTELATLRENAADADKNRRI